MSWDQTAVLTSVKGAGFAFGEIKGQMIVETSGYNRWVNKDDGNHTYLTFKKSANELSGLIERYMMHEPVAER